MHGVKFRAGQVLEVGNVIHYELFLGSDDSGIRIFEQLHTVTTQIESGDYVDFWFDHPSEEKINTLVFARAMVEEFQDTKNPKTA